MTESGRDRFPHMDDPTLGAPVPVVYEASRRDRIGVAVMNALGRVLVSRAYRDAHSNVHQTAIRCRLYHGIDTTKGTATHG